MVWKKGVEFEEGEKDLSSKGLFPLLKNQPLSGTEPLLGLLTVFVFGVEYIAQAVAQQIQT